MTKANILTRNKKKKAQQLLSQGQLTEAKMLFEQICKADRLDADAWSDLGNVHGMLGDFSNARACFDKIVQLKPHSAETYINLAKALAPLGLFDEAVSAYKKALDITPDDLVTHRYLNATLVRSGKLDEAYTGYDRMLEISPDKPEIIAAKAKLLEIKGEKKQAYELLSPLIRQYPGNPKIAVAFAAACDEADHRNEAIRLLETITENPRIRLQHEIESEVHFALGKLYDRASDYSKAFGHFAHANRVKGRTFDMKNFADHVDEVIKAFSAEALNRVPCSSIQTNSAVFIVGMPRSGTSLVEQILASHPDVAPGGELYEIVNLVTEITNLVESHNLYPRYLNELTGDLCNYLAQRYVDRLKDISPASRYVTNKMPQNFLYLGLISKILPQARIIHCLRDARDTCVSCFFQDFTQGHGYAYNLETLGTYYRQYQKIMAHWDKVVDQPVLPIQYEELVADPENQTRRLLEFLDLPWDDSCLHFYKNKRVIPTASYDQVRQPLYKNSAGRWKNYEAYLQPLLKALAD